MSPENTGKESGEGKPRGADLSERMDRLSRSLDAKRQAEEVRHGSKREGDAKGIALALRLSTEFVAGILVGSGIGWLIDSGLGTSPWGLIVFLLLGFVAGVINVLRSAGLVSDPYGGGRGRND
ncbi:hypothetical protein GR183_14300 [Stappia sp. GBMRC 2046]|uniref:ATP synthase protein I n=1 Tax=Stappia sediminis TaxID=2692190 RepID=A0A7X3LVZ0_9HYPH|nr:AtpZ/AtpI family protein [Stappia sediminis]MXN66082.1 hypothetical protein [Stappia sediminis]